MRRAVGYQPWAHAGRPGYRRHLRGHRRRRQGRAGGAGARGALISRLHARSGREPPLDGVSGPRRARLRFRRARPAPLTASARRVALEGPVQPAGDSLRPMAVWCTPASPNARCPGPGPARRVVAVCTRYASNDAAEALDTSHFAQAKETTAKLNADGYRVIAVAFKELPPAQAAYSVADESNLTLLGYIAFLDPPKETAAPAIATLKARGVQVKILTGDNDIVSRKVCHDVGLPSDRIVLGSEIETLSPDELANLAESRPCSQRSRRPRRRRSSTPCTERGHVVGYLGDGINDGPALKAADVGISVDSAVDIAKETADIILLEKSSAVLGDGVLEAQGSATSQNTSRWAQAQASGKYAQRNRRQYLPALPAHGADPGAHRRLCRLSSHPLLRMHPYCRRI